MFKETNRDNVDENEFPQNDATLITSDEEEAYKSGGGPRSSENKEQSTKKESISSSQESKNQARENDIFPLSMFGITLPPRKKDDESCVLESIDGDEAPTETSFMSNSNELDNAVDSAHMVSMVAADQDENVERIVNAPSLPLGITLLDAQEDAEMRRLTGYLHWQWRSVSISGLERRLHDFHFARKRRKDKYGGSKPWGILGLYEHLAGIRTDVEWAEDAAWRREQEEPYFSWADFDESRKSGLDRPFLTYCILIICSITLVWSIAENGWKVEPLNINPMIGPSAQTLLGMGAKQTSLIVNNHQWYRLFTPMVLHAGFVHYSLNMLALWFVGSAVEMTHGFLAAAILFIVPAVGGTILSAIFLPQYISVGASGGIFGLIGACIADISMNWSLLFNSRVNVDDTQTTTKHVRIVILLFFDVALNCVIGFTPLVDNFIHLGGMMYGFLCGLSTMKRLSWDFFGVMKKELSLADKTKRWVGKYLGLIISIIMVIVSAVLLSKSGASGKGVPCKFCRYLSCVPFPPWKNSDEKWWYCDDCGIVTADARRNSYGIFDELIMTCPDKQITIIDVSSDGITDRNALARGLPEICRSHCESRFT